MLGKPLSVVYVNNPVFGGFFRLAKDCRSGFLVVNTVGDRTNPDAAGAAKDTSTERMIEFVRAGAGIPTSTCGSTAWPAGGRRPTRPGAITTGGSCSPATQPT